MGLDLAGLNVKTSLLCFIGLIVEICRSQEFVDDKIVGVSEDRTCTPLENPEHGKYRCKNFGDKEVCILVCDEGFVVPLTYVQHEKPHLDVSKRGIYRCEKVPGGLTWRPNLLYDCVERIVPTVVKFHFNVIIFEPCIDEDTTIEYWSSVFVEGHTLRVTCNLKLELDCEAEYYVKCTNTSERTLMDIIINVPYSEELHDNFKYIRRQMSQSMELDRLELFVSDGKAARKTAISDGFFTNCPPGTIVEQDFTCRGCSKGYFMDLAILKCTPCPIGTYQDEDLSATCKQCPEVGTRKELAVKSSLQCFYSHNYKTYTSVNDLLTAAACIVMISTTVIYFRCYVTNEPGPKTKEKEIYILDEDKNTESTWGTDESSSDVKVSTDKPRKSALDDDTLRKSILVKTLPMEPRPKTKEQRKSMADERMLLSMEALAMRRMSVALARRTMHRFQTKPGEQYRKSLIAKLWDIEAQRRKVDILMPTQDEVVTQKKYGGKGVSFSGKPGYIKGQSSSSSGSSS